MARSQPPGPAAGLGSVNPRKTPQRPDRSLPCILPAHTQYITPGRRV